MKIKQLVVGLVVCVFALIGIMYWYFTSLSQSQQGYGDFPVPPGAVSVWHDNSNKVTCWIFAGFYKGGIHCIPDWQLIEQK